MKRIYLAAPLIGVLCAATGWGSVPPARADDTDTAKQLIQSATADALGSFGGQALAPAQQRAGLQALLARYGDMAFYAADLLGRYWGRASADQQTHFPDLLDRYILASWSSQLNGISPQLRIDFTTAEATPGGMIVHSLAVIPTDSFAVDWTISRAADGHLIIADIAVDGYSILQTMKGDFLSTLRANQGRVEVLEEALEGKIAGYGR